MAKSKSVNKFFDDGDGNGNGDGDSVNCPYVRERFFLVGYRKFIVALLWVLLMALCVIWVVIAREKPSSGQVAVTIWLIAGCGFFCAFFVGGNALVQIWASKFGPPQTTANLTQANTQTQNEQTVNQKVEVVTYDPKEDSAWREAEGNLPPKK